MSEADGEKLERSLRRIETLIEALDSLPDPAAAGSARELLELVLDLHGLALARVGAIVAGAADGTRLLQSLAEDEQVRAVLLLHGLHPDEVEVRVRRALAELRPQLMLHGVRAELIQASATQRSRTVRRRTVGRRRRGGRAARDRGGDRGGGARSGRDRHRRADESAFAETAEVAG